MTFAEPRSAPRSCQRSSSFLPGAPPPEAHGMAESEADRLRRARTSRGLTQEKLADAAGVDQTAISKAETGKMRMEDATAGRVADALGVNLVWLREGKGAGPEPASATASPPARRGDSAPPVVASPMVVREPGTAELALLAAYVEDSERLDPRDFLAGLDLIRASEQMLPRGREGAIGSMKKLLRAIARARRDGLPITLATLVGELLTEDANAEGLAQLRELGGEPPREPVRTPPRGTQAVPKTVGTGQHQAKAGDEKSAKGK